MISYLYLLTHHHLPFHPLSHTQIHAHTLLRYISTLIHGYAHLHVTTFVFVNRQRFVLSLVNCATLRLSAKIHERELERIRDDDH